MHSIALPKRSSASPNKTPLSTRRAFRADRMRSTTTYSKRRSSAACRPGSSEVASASAKAPVTTANSQAIDYGGIWAVYDLVLSTSTGMRAGDPQSRTERSCSQGPTLSRKSVTALALVISEDAKTAGANRSKLQFSAHNAIETSDHRALRGQVAPLRAQSGRRPGNASRGRDISVVSLPIGALVRLRGWNTTG
jgi:hypothetical protein